MQYKYKIKKDGQPIAMPCTKEQWEAIKPELDKIEGVDCEEVIDTFDEENILVNNYMGVIGNVANMGSLCINKRDRTYIDTHDKEAFINSLRGEPIENEVKEVKQESPFNDEYWERLYHECAVKTLTSFASNEQWSKSFTNDDFDDYRDRITSASREISKQLIEELKNNPLK